MLDASHDGHALKYPSLHMLTWVLNLVLNHKECVPSEKLFSVYRSLVHALKSPFVPIKQQVFHLLANFLNHAHNSQVDAHMNLLPLSSLRALATYRLQKER